MSTVGDALSSIQSFLCRNKRDTMFNNSADCMDTLRCADYDRDIPKLHTEKHPI